ncbi:MAG TPA: hypothetical protein VLG50_05870 [Candidatus Saccharimonadales bacterium]|nr:hypothetical protein [Candidatus Saccharimonadales bacterium]
MDMDNIKIESGMTFEQFLSQFQPYCPHVICLETDVQYNQWIMIYKKLDQIPTDIKYINTMNDYYHFINTVTNHRYCLFGYDAACIFYPKLDNKSINHSLIEYIGDYDRSVVLYYGNKTLEFKKSKKMLELTTVKIF